MLSSSTSIHPGEETRPLDRCINSGHLPQEIPLRKEQVSSHFLAATLKANGVVDRDLKIEIESSVTIGKVTG